MTRRGPNSIDKIVGRNIRIYRLQIGLSQTDLADKLGVTFQQVQKYENGTNRVSAGKLFTVASIMSVPITALFRGSEIGPETKKQSIFDQIAEPNTNRLVQAFAKIDREGVRSSVVRLVEVIAKISD
jgi:transcriptional regulator with XRE-family HTH domain